MGSPLLETGLRCGRGRFGFDIDVGNDHVLVTRSFERDERGEGSLRVAHHEPGGHPAIGQDHHGYTSRFRKCLLSDISLDDLLSHNTEGDRGKRSQCISAIRAKEFDRGHRGFLSMSYWLWIPKAIAESARL
jgi:hypothetical protein